MEVTLHACKQTVISLFTSTNNSKGTLYLVPQKDGNLVIYSPSAAVWDAHTSGQGGTGTHLVMQNDGNLVLYDGSKALW